VAEAEGPTREDVADNCKIFMKKSAGNKNIKYLCGKFVPINKFNSNKMKKALIFSALATVLAANVSAQSFQTMELEQNVLPTRESFITNKWFDNIFLGVGAGASTSFGKEIEDNYFTPTFNVTLLKWFSPTIGARIGFQQFYGKEGLNGYAPYQMAGGHSALPYKVDGKFVKQAYGPGTLYYGHAYFNGSILWNLTQFFGYYRADRFYNISLHVDGGYSHLYDNKDKDGDDKGIRSSNYDREFSLGAGLYNTFRINDRWNATADLVLMGYSGDYRTDRGYVTFVPNLTVGIAYNIYKTRWNEKKEYVDRVVEAENTTVIVKKENAALEKTVETKDFSISNLEKELGSTRSTLAKTDAELQDLKAKMYVYTAYFELDKAKVSFAEKQHVKKFVENILQQNPDHVFKLTGSADKGTGSFSHNTKLASNRAENIRKYMVKELGVKEENIVINEPLVTDSQMDASFDRCVRIDR